MHNRPTQACQMSVLTAWPRIIHCTSFLRSLFIPNVCKSDLHKKPHWTTYITYYRLHIMLYFHIINYVLMGCQIQIKRNKFRKNKHLQKSNYLCLTEHHMWIENIRSICIFWKKKKKIIIQECHARFGETLFDNSRRLSHVHNLR